MKRSLLSSAFLLGALSLAGCGGGGTTASAVPPARPMAAAGTTVSSDLRELLSSGRASKVCDAPEPGDNATCFSVVLTQAGREALGLHSTATTVSGYGPSDLSSAYNLTGTGGTGRLVAIVDAYDDPNLESDLGVYRSHFGLSPCTTANGCFKKVGQTGTSSYPRTNASWAEETSLDVDMVSANCPNCNILVVEANSATIANLAASVDTAASLGAIAISNSYGSSESSSETTYAPSYNHAGIAITVSNGDSGYGAATPASYNTVTAVGGTNLQRSATTRGWSEVVWTSTGSGCSAYISKPSWQTDTGCAQRTIGDLAYDADPNTGVAVYDSLSYQGRKGWLVFGGTSVGSPSIAALYARSGDTVSNASKIYANAASLNDITSGSNGTCSVAYLCTGEVGYDGPTGLGTPNGFGAF